MSMFIYVVATEERLRAGLRAAVSGCPSTFVQSYSSLGRFLADAPECDSGIILLGASHANYAQMLADLPSLSIQSGRFVVVFASENAEPGVVACAIKSGAHEFLPLPADRTAVAQVMSSAHAAVVDMAENLAEVAAAQALISQLSDREKTVFLCLADGLTNRDIADRLHISLRTVEVHRARLMAKLGAGSFALAIRLAYIAGFLPAHSGQTLAANT